MAADSRGGPAMQPQRGRRARIIAINTFMIGNIFINGDPGHGGTIIYPGEIVDVLIFNDCAGKLDGVGFYQAKNGLSTVYWREISALEELAMATAYAHD